MSDRSEERPSGDGFEAGWRPRLPAPARHSVANRRTSILFDAILPDEDGPDLGREIREESESDIPGIGHSNSDATTMGGTVAVRYRLGPVGWRREQDPRRHGQLD